MINSKLPIYPCPYKGLTKREHFILEITKSVLTSEIDTSVSTISKYLGINKDEYKGLADFDRYVIKRSINIANQLMREIESLNNK